jgi:DNA repair exonuclease SbcCD ATPase subunit
MEVKTVEQLQQENEALKAELKTAEENYQTLESLSKEQADKTAVDVEAIKKENEDLKAENEALYSVNQELTSKIEELSSDKPITEAAEKAAVKEKPVLPEAPFEVGGKKYKFLSPVFMHKKQRITAVQALTDSDTLEMLVSSKSGVIKEVE